MPVATRAPLACVIALALATGCGKKEAPPVTKGPVDVTFVTVSPRDVPAVFEFVGTTQSSRQVNIQARVNGFLDKRVYTEGAIVKEGQVLFLMDKKPFQAQVDAAQAQLSKAQAALEVAKANLARVKPLAEAEALSQKDLDDANGNFQSAAASVEGAKAQLESAQLNLSYCTIASPVTGISGAAAQADGTYLNQSNSQLTTVAVLSPMWVNFSLSENEVQAFRDQVARGQLTRPAGIWSYGGSIVGPIFAGGAIAGQVAQAEAQQKAALANYELAVQNAFADVENALAANANLAEQLAAQQRLVRALSEYARLARLQFSGGYTSYTTVLQAEQQLFPSELNLATIHAQLYGSLVNIYKALGGGWVDKADGLAPQPALGALPERGSAAVAR